MDTYLREAYKDVKTKYLDEIAISLEKYFKDILSDFAIIDRIAVRVKSVDRFVQKANKRNEDGNRKYDNPLKQIQDLIGARIIVFYECEICSITRSIEQYFRHIEKTTIVPDSVNEFGYEGVHYIMFLPEDVLPSEECKLFIQPFFELQIKSLYQHAWSEANHDLCYKPNTNLAIEEKRKVAFTAAQSWGADMIFNELYKKSLQ
ncbi:MAG TPA: hypothetical protein VF857_05405 [Spirochaetota bacterium]